MVASCRVLTWLRVKSSSGAHVAFRRSSVCVSGGRRRQDRDFRRPGRSRCGARGYIDWEVLAVNELEGPNYDSPALVGDQIYVRMPSRLYSFGHDK